MVTAEVLVMILRPALLLGFKFIDFGFGDIMSKEHQSLKYIIGWNLFCRFPNVIRKIFKLKQKPYSFPVWYQELF